MNKTVLKNMEKIKEERKLSKKSKDAIIARCVANAAIGISIMLLIFTFIFARNFLDKNIAMFIYNVCAIIFLSLTIVLFEIAYKKDSGKIALVSVELFILTIITLFAPYFLYKFSIIYIYGIIALTAIYYTVKIIRISFKERKQYLFNSNDFSNIIKKESKDELAQEQIEQEEQERKENEKKNQNITIDTNMKNVGVPLSKRSPRKVASKKEITKNKVKKDTTKTKKTTAQKDVEKESVAKPKATKKTTTAKKTTVAKTTKKVNVDDNTTEKPKKTRTTSSKKVTSTDVKPTKTTKTRTAKSTNSTKTTKASKSTRTTRTRKTTQKEIES